MQNMHFKKIFKNDTLLWLHLSQGIVLFGTGLVFPFYIIYINQIGPSFSDFGVAYGLFALSAALVHKYVGQLSDRLGRKIFLLIHSWGTAVLFLLFPIASSLTHIYILQILLGVFGAMHRTGEKALVGDLINGKDRGKYIGRYHGWISIFSAFAVIIGGYLIDLFTLPIIFYIGSGIMFISGFIIIIYKEKNV